MMKINAQEVSNIIMPCSFLAEEAISVFSELVDNIFCFKDVLVSVYGTGVDSYMLWRLCNMLLCQGDRSNGYFTIAKRQLYYNYNYLQPCSFCLKTLFIN